MSRKVSTSGPTICSWVSDIWVRSTSIVGYLYVPNILPPTQVYTECHRETQLSSCSFRGPHLGTRIKHHLHSIKFAYHQDRCNEIMETHDHLAEDKTCCSGAYGNSPFLRKANPQLLTSTENGDDRRNRVTEYPLNISYCVLCYGPRNN